MLVHEFEAKFGDLPDSADAVVVFGKDKLTEGVVNLGDIRKICQDKPKHAVLKTQGDGWGVFVTELASKGDAVIAHENQPSRMQAVIDFLINSRWATWIRGTLYSYPGPRLDS